MPAIVGFVCDDDDDEVAPAPLDGIEALATLTGAGADFVLFFP